jgi:CHAT domain-containing protein
MGWQWVGWQEDCGDASGARAAYYRACRQLLSLRTGGEMPEDPAPAPEHAAGTADAGGAGLQEVRAARDGLDGVIREIRRTEGFDQFLAAPSFADVARAAARVPLVYFAAAEMGGLALVVRGETVTPVPLGGLTAGVLRDRATAHMAAYAAYRAAPGDARDTWYGSLDSVTRWLWTAAVAPVLAVLRPSTEAVFVAGGLLGLLPLHAAWTTDRRRPTGRRYALDEVAISYAPNARSLLACQQLAAEVQPDMLLAVAEPRPVAATPLPGATVEAAVAEARFPHHMPTLAGGAASPLAFRGAASSADVLHLACHGYAVLEDPLDSGLLLAGNRRVTLRHFLHDYQLRVRLAVLSACETALPGTELPDEVVALPTGLVQAGVAGVVASQWSVPDRATAMLMAEFYRRWPGPGVTVAGALRAAQRWLRDTTNEDKRRAWQAAQRAGELSGEVAEYFDDAVFGLEPDAREHQAVHRWAAFAHVGA